MDLAEALRRRRHLHAYRSGSLGSVGRLEQLKVLQAV